MTRPRARKRAASSQAVWISIISADMPMAFIVEPMPLNRVAPVAAAASMKRIPSAPFC